MEELKTERGFPQANVYGETELGGLGRVYALTAPPSAYGLPEKPGYPTMANIWQRIAQPLGEVAIGATILGALAWWVAVRRNIRMEEVE